MDSALKLVTQHGYRNVRLEDVARDAGVSKATIYHYFADKDDLLTKMVSTRIAEKQADAEQQLLSAGGTAAQRLRLFLRQFWELSLTTRAGLWQRLLVSELVTDAPDVFDAWARGHVQRWRFAEALIRDGQRAGEFRREIDAAIAGRTIISALSHQALFHVHLGVRRFAPCSTDDLFDETVAQFIDGLRIRPRSSGA